MDPTTNSQPSTKNTQPVFVRGYQTTEFWLTLGTIVSTVGGVFFGALPKLYATIAIAIIVAGYAVGRGLAKINQ